jgi:hypothetical protein
LAYRSSSDVILLQTNRFWNFAIYKQIYSDNLLVTSQSESKNYIFFKCSYWHTASNFTSSLSLGRMQMLNFCYKLNCFALHHFIWHLLLHMVKKKGYFWNVCINHLYLSLIYNTVSISPCYFQQFMEMLVCC